MSSPAEQDQTTERVAVFVCSSDNTFDVFQRVFPALRKFWPACPYPVYVGLNEAQAQDGIVLRAPAAGWREELKQQIAAVPHDFILLVLDDFLVLEPVDQARLRALIAQAVARDLPYTRMIPATRALLPALLHRLAAFFVRDPFQVLPASIPYYSSLQIALWRKDHLLAMFGEEGNIWQFEHQRRPGVVHRALRSDPPIRYMHVVEKGRWQPHAPAMFARAGLDFDPGARALRPAGDRWLERYKTVKFMLIGYSVVRFKRWWRNRGPVADAGEVAKKH